MTTITYNNLSTAGLRTQPSFKMPNFVERRAALPDMAAEGTLVARAVDVVSAVALAAVPFSAIGWMFLAH
jgi:hypothetical protein